MDNPILIADDSMKEGDIELETPMVDSESYKVDHNTLKLVMNNDYHEDSDSMNSNRIKCEPDYSINWNGCEVHEEDLEMPAEKIWFKTEMESERFEDNSGIYTDANAKNFFNRAAQQKIAKKRPLVSEKRKTLEQNHHGQNIPFQHMSTHSAPNERTLNISGTYSHHGEINHRQPMQQAQQHSYSSNFGGIPMQQQNNTDGSGSLEEVTALEKLLQTWGLEDLKAYFIQQKITVNVLKIIRMHHIEKLFKDVPVGTQVLFEHHLRNWRKTIGSPLDNTLQNDVDNLNVQKSCVPTPSMHSTPAPSNHPYLNPAERVDAGAKIHLADILNTVKGRMLCTFYEANQRFEEEQRNALVNLISQYFDEKQIPMSLATSYKIEKEIIARFKNEKLEYYRTKKRGKIYNKCSNQKKITTERLIKKTVVKKSRLKGDFVPEEGAEACLRALQFENLTEEQFDSYWKACAHYRLNDIKTMPNRTVVFQKWPFYKKLHGSRLVDIDYEIAFGNGGLLVHNWEKCSPSIVAFLSKDGHIKDKAARALLDKVFKETCNENGKYASILWAVHGYLVPAAKFCSKNITGKTTHTKYTIKDSQESFLFCAKTQQEAEEHITNLKARKSVIPPFLLCMGEDISNVANICVYFDDIFYSFYDIIKAVDICFKMIYIFNLEFPQESKMFWNFIEKAFYNHDVPLESPKVHMICESILQ
ncbi:unnamed protein product [Callosobruchus maculatus]|uniref:SAM domain-containing protein n=1 Tax=Callosobruchus maculatus TaxID=64391 RepID=A0A653D936_CALMS|nr:unnamed protein product [Callosobruchus maculatus]